MRGTLKMDTRMTRLLQGRPGKTQAPGRVRAPNKVLAGGSGDGTANEEAVQVPREQTLRRKGATALAQTRLWGVLLTLHCPRCTWSLPALQRIALQPLALSMHSIPH